MSRIVESLYRISGIELNEARNPANEAFNSIIRGILKRGRLTKKDINALHKLGYEFDGDNLYYFFIIAPNGNYLEYYDGDIDVYDKNDEAIYYDSNSLQDVDWQNLLNSHNGEEEEVIQDDISDFAIAKKKYNNEKSKLNDLYSTTKDTQLDTIQYRRSNPNQIHRREEKDLEYQRRRVQKAKEEKDAILKKHGINPRESYSASKHSRILEDLSLKSIEKINRSPWGEDALNVVLNNISDKLDGYDDFGAGFDVSYQGSTKELINEIVDVYSKAGIEIRKEGRNKISYDNGGQTVYITVSPDDDASTYTENSQGYFIYVENVE